VALSNHFPRGGDPRGPPLESDSFKTIGGNTIEVQANRQAVGGIFLDRPCWCLVFLWSVVKSAHPRGNPNIRALGSLTKDIKLSERLNFIGKTLGLVVKRRGQET